MTFYAFEAEIRHWKHRFNSKPIPPVEIDTKCTAKTVPFYSEGKEVISI